MPKLSIIVPVYKVEPYIHKCVDSILNQTFTDFELILVDDGSPDSCGKICDEYVEKDNRVRVIHKENGGVSDARNKGIAEAEGEYISFIDPDDWIELNAFEKIIRYIDDNKLDICCFDVCEVRSNKRICRNLFSKNMIFERNEATYKILVDEIDNSPCNKVYNKKVWTNVEFPKGRRFEDVATIYKIFYNSQKIGYLREALYYYLKRKGSAIALSFDAQRRYECFLGYNERFEFAQKYCQEAVEKCKMFAVKAALSAITAESAGKGIIKVNDKKALKDFLDNVDEVQYLNGKNRILFWGAKKCVLINKIYGKLSYISKKIK